MIENGGGAGWTWVVWVGLAATVLVFIILAMSGARRRRRREPESAGGLRPALTDYQREFVRTRVQTYCEEMLSYELRLECIRRGKSEGLLLKVLQDRKLRRVNTMPVLYLNMDGQVWDHKLFHEAVTDATREVLGRDIALDERSPDADAKRECEQWAEGEARRLLEGTPSS